MKKRIISSEMVMILLVISICTYFPSTTAYASGGYDVSKAVAYAHQYYENYNPAYPNYNSSGGDCANFVSQCLYAGGLKQDSVWYSGSRAWISCNNQINYFKGKGYKVIDYASASDIKPGNPVYYYNGSKITHTAICVGYDSNGTPLVAAHNKNHWNYEWTLGGAKWWGGSTRRVTILITDNTSNQCSCSKSYSGDYIVSTSSLPLTMRSGHGTGYSTITQIPKGSTVYVSMANGSWAHVEWNGYTGYCSMEYLTRKSTVKAPLLNVWFTDSVVPGESMGEPIGSEQFKACGVYYLCYELTDPDTGNPFNADSNYTVKETVYRPNGSQVLSYSYDQSPNNWISFQVDASGDYKGVVEISGDYTGSVTVRITAPDTSRIRMKAWFSETKMGSEITELEKGKFYYLCYRMEHADTNRKLNDIIVLNYDVKEEVKDPNGKMVHSYSYGNSDNNWIGFTASETGIYKGYAYMTGDYTHTMTASAVCKEKTVSVTRLTLSDVSLNLAEGDEKTLMATVFPSNATNKNVTWESDNMNVATVKNGVVKAVSAGTAKITVTAVDGSVSATCNVTVSKKTVGVIGVSLNKTSITLTEGEKQTLAATVSPLDATDKSVQWTSSNTRVATVSNGTVTAVGEGTATITVTTINGSKMASCKVTVLQNTVQVSSISLNKTSLTLSNGEKQTLTATVLPSDATDKSVQWTSSNTRVATVSNGTVTAVGEGTAVITVQTNDGSKRAECMVKVVKAEDEVNAELVVAKVSATTGSEATVDVSVKNNPGITALKVLLEYPDNVLTLTNVEYPKLFSSRGTGGNQYKSPFVMSWFSTRSQNETASGIFARLTFKVKENVATGSYPIQLSYDADNVININGDKVNFNVENGEVVIYDSMSGDINGDKLINMKDLVLLQQKLNGWNVVIDESAADVNKDGSLNMKDIVLLQQYLNGWNVSLK